MISFEYIFDSICILKIILLNKSTSSHKYFNLFVPSCKSRLLFLLYYQSCTSHDSDFLSSSYVCFARNRADRRPAGVTIDPVTSEDDRVDLRLGVPVVSVLSSSSSLSSLSSSSFLLLVTFFLVFGTDTDDKPSIAKKPISAI